MTPRARSIDGVRIEVSDDCAGSAQCILVAPAVFEIDEEGCTKVVDGTLPVRAVEQARAAEDVCPMGAIRVLQLPEK